MPQRPEDAVREARPGERPEFLRERASARDHEGPVNSMMDRLQGMSRRDVIPDNERGAISSLGHGKTKRR